MVRKYLGSNDGVVFWGEFSYYRNCFYGYIIAECTLSFMDPENFVILMIFADGVWPNFDSQKVFLTAKELQELFKKRLGILTKITIVQASVWQDMENSKIQLNLKKL